jgi:hypothetical protein
LQARTLCGFFKRSSTSESIPLAKFRVCVIAMVWYNKKSKNGLSTLNETEESNRRLSAPAERSLLNIKMKKMKRIAIVAIALLMIISMTGCKKEMELQPLKHPVPNIGYGLPEDVGNISGNIANSGLVAEGDNYIYYVDLYKGGSIVSINKLNGEQKVIVSDTARYLNYYKGTLYYMNYSDKGYIYSVNQIGEEKKLIAEVPAYDINIINDTIYFTHDGDNSYIYCMNLDGKNLKKHSIKYGNISVFSTRYGMHRSSFILNTTSYISKFMG